MGGFFIFWLKFINIIADTIAVYLVYKSVSRLADVQTGLFASSLYAFNPVTVLVVGYQGQFDAMPTLFLLLALFQLL